MKNEIKTICFYLPQFHSIPENDNAYGKGFTEWTNVKKAHPLFPGHVQPKIPLNNNYYSLMDPSVMEKQARLAKEYGIYGFCYYHYWFKNRKKLLEKPIEMMLANPQIDIPFCLCWANENWTKKWDGGNNEIIVEQDYGNMSDLNKHVDYLCKYFSDKRYITVDGAPLLLIYKPELIPGIRKYIKMIRERAKENGFKKIKIAVQYPKYFFDGGMLNLFDYYIEFEPQFIISYEMNRNRRRINKMVKPVLLNFGARGFVNKIEEKRTDKTLTINHKNTLEIRDYDEDWEKIISHDVRNKKMLAGAFVDWDNTSRNINGRVYKGASPEKFNYYMSKLVRKVRSEYSEKIIFINAWNEWAEGAYLEPDENNKYEYLNALKDALNINVN